MRPRRLLIGLFVSLAALVAAGLGAVSADDGRSATMRLEPGLNYVGWISEPIDVAGFFDDVPQAQLVYAWDAAAGRYRVAARQFRGDLDRIETGMAVIVRIGGEEPVDWRRSSVADGERIALSRGFNLVAWTGPSGTPLNLALRSIGPVLRRAHYRLSPNGGYRAYDPQSSASLGFAPTIEHGDVLWIVARRAGTWLQPSGDRALYRLPAPPAQLGLDPHYQKYLNADGLVIVSSLDAADEALFRTAAVIDDMLADRPDIRETLIDQGVYVVVAGRTETFADLPDFRHLVDSHLNPGTVAGLGPTASNPMLVSERLANCTDGGLSPIEDVIVHEMGHAVELALSHMPGWERFRQELASAYDADIAAGLFESTYASLNVQEYWAEGVQSWFGLNTPQSGFFRPNQIDTRGELMSETPRLARLLRQVFGEADVTSSCHPVVTEDNDQEYREISGVVRDRHGQPVTNLVIKAATIQPALSTYSLGSDIDGTFYNWIPDGGFQLFIDVWRPNRKSVRPLWVGEGRLVDDQEQAKVLMTHGSDVSGIEVVLQDDEITFLIANVYPSWRGG